MDIKVVAFTIASLLSANALAVSIDYRHEVKDTAENSQKDRLLISHRFSNGFGLSSEVKWKTGDSDAESNKVYHENVSDGYEVVPSYLYRLNKLFALEGGINLAVDSSYTNYRPYVKSYVYFTDDLNWSLRLRPFYKRYSGNINTEKDTQEKGVTVTSVVSYRLPGNWGMEYELEYHKTNSEYYSPVADNKDYQWTHDIKVSYAIDKNWKPYVAVANVPGSKYTDERQTRYRVGVTYSF
ncbi:Oligogalacturonate-specific porin protein KdgM [Klebsiella variicola]|uniref:oligogalacturonate-specific porin KdgM family protein n=1 Tax=Enterobacteriaceae TaxID=543 RepID=UPI000D745316|nr:MULTISPECIES: oligogalacturonate-specific porin KdgM family protein [Enterobacteriaceae]HBC5610843.1 porin [Klebsiella oxytoca]MBK0078977.1 porin [Kosakonia sp. S57]MBK0085912.1 porin [Kosakonia sp. S58]PXK70369.1 porin [Klebsiella variicola]SXE25930.1 Oligogalacturonate-specific porin protein KdgM [Klebsiella variicola]